MNFNKIFIYINLFVNLIKKSSENIWDISLQKIGDESG